METQTIKVNMLGEFSISSEAGVCKVSDKSGRSKKVLTLLEYLITFRGREIPQNELIEVLWPDEDSEEPENTLKTLVHRARASLEPLQVGKGRDLIVTRRGIYSWNNSYDTVVDVEEFARLCQLAEEGSDEERLEHMLRALRLYKGDFLPKSTAELWAVALSTSYHTLYINTLHEAVRLLTERGRFEEIVDLCQKAASIDPYDEQLHLYIIRAMIKDGMQQAAMHHYQSVTRLYMDEFGITPSKELTELYREITRSVNLPEMNLHIIQEDLREAEKASTAFFCEFGIFKDIYRLLARATWRTGSGVQLALMTVEDPEKKLTAKQMTLAMSRLRDVISNSLRNSDVFSRYSVSQYILMLPDATMEDGEMVLERIRSNFHKLYPHMNLMFRYNCQPMEPNL